MKKMKRILRELTMTKLRIIQRDNYAILRFVEIKKWHGWVEIYSGSLEDCERFIDQYPFKVIKEVTK